MRVASVALGGDGEAGDAVRIGDERIGIRQTALPSGRPTGADISGAVEHQFRLAAICGGAEQR